MKLHELGIINTQIPKFGPYTNGKISNLYIIYKSKKISTYVSVNFQESKKSGLFFYDINENTINCLNKKECEENLSLIDKVLDKENYSKFIYYIANTKKEKEIIEIKNFFIPIDNNSENSLYDANAEIIIKEIDKRVECNICVLHSSSGMGKTFINFDCENISKSELQHINFSSMIDISLNFSKKEIINFGNIVKFESEIDKINMVIDSIPGYLLSKHILGELNFNNLSPGEMVNLIINSTKAVRVGQIEGITSIKRKFKYITILNNFDIEEDEIFIGDIVISKKIREKDKFKLNSGKYVYISIYVVADTINEAKQIAFNKISNVINFIELVNKNSCFYKLYNKNKEYNKWDIEDLLVDFKLNDQFYIYNIIFPEQSAYGSNKNLIIKKIGKISNTSEILEFKEQLEPIVYNYDEKKNKMFNAIFWLNKTLQTLFYDINQSIIYINIAIEYSVSQEPPQNYYGDYPELEDLVNEFRKIIDSKIINKKLNSQVKNIVAKIQYDNSVNARFFNMMERMKINLTEKQEQNYRNIRKARNSIIHNNEEIDITQHDIIECYMTISKVIFYRITEEINEFI